MRARLLTHSRRGLMIAAGAAMLPARARAVEDPISIEEDLGVFAVFALLNAAGYDHENTSAMHPVRLKVRAAMKGRVPAPVKAEVDRFYAATKAKASTWSWTITALATGGPPHFASTPEWLGELAGDPQFAPLSPLQPLLARFFREAAIPELYAEVRPAYLDYIAAYRGAVRREVAAVLAYLRVEKDPRLAPGKGEIGRARVIPNLLESYEKAFAFVLGGRFTSVEGPQKAVGYNPHEFVHAVTNPLSYDPRHAVVQARAEPLLAAARERLKGAKPTATMAAFFDECLVRAVSLRYLLARRPEREGELEAEMTAEFAAGWTLERFFWNGLKRFEIQRGDFTSFYPALISALDPGAELAAWKAGGR